MSCLNGRKRHMWVRGTMHLHTGSFKEDNDKCAWCGKFRSDVENRKEYDRRRKINKDLDCKYCLNNNNCPVHHDKSCIKIMRTAPEADLLFDRRFWKE